MGQYWQIINLDKKETTGNLGKLGPFLMSGRAAVLIGLLIVPPPGSSQSTDISRPAGRWVGDRIICVGDYGTDAPPGLLSDEEVGDYKGDENQLNLYTAANNHFSKIRDQIYPFHDDSSWVLRNLTKHEYVRQDAVAASRAERHGPYVSWGKFRGRSGPGFGEAVLSHISWSTDNSAAMSYDELTRGVWAGDRFDIQIIDSVEGVEGWIDVSEEVVDEISEIWTSDGYEWEKD